VTRIVVKSSPFGVVIIRSLTKVVNQSIGVITFADDCKNALKDVI